MESSRILKEYIIPLQSIRQSPLILLNLNDLSNKITNKRTTHL